MRRRADGHGDRARALQLLDGEQDLALADRRVDLDVDQVGLERRQARLPAAAEDLHRRPSPDRPPASPARFRMQRDRAQEALEARDPVTALDAVVGPRAAAASVLQLLVEVGAGAPRGRTGIPSRARAIVSRPRSARSLPARSSKTLASERRRSRARTEAPVIQSTIRAATNRAATTPTCTPIGTRVPESG